jgi:hypothetical protein
MLLFFSFLVYRYCIDESKFLDMDGTTDTPYALDYSESMAFFNSAYNQTSAQSITATEFDIAQELLWAGTNEV